MEVKDNSMGGDTALVAAALGGGPEEFGAIVERYQDAVFAVVLSRLRRFHDAEDVTQVAFVEAYGRLDKLKDPNRLGAWLRSIAIHKSIDHLRRRKDEAPIDGAEEERASASSWRAESGRRELREEVMAAIGRLSKTQRETTTLFYINGYSVEEVANIQEVPVGTVSRRLHDARKRLKEEMVGMVEQVLKSEAPKPDLAARVFDLVRIGAVDRANWGDPLAELKKIGAEGIEGYIKALESPHGKTRASAVQMMCIAKPTGEVVVDLLRRALGNPNRKARSFAVVGLLSAEWGIDVSAERRRTEFVPLAVPLLRDRSEHVRSRTAQMLWEWAPDVPIEAVAEALLEAKSPKARRMIRRLLRKVLDARKDGGAKE